MQKKILVVTATPGFGELIQQALSETGAYRVSLLSSAAEAIGLVQESAFVLGILDSDVEDLPFKDCLQALRKVAPDMHLVLIPPDSDQENLGQQYPGVQGFLSKPFYLPDLLGLVEKTIGPVPAIPLAAPKAEDRKGFSPPPAWLEDVSRAAQHLTGLLLGTAAQAALIVKEGQLWAYAGQLAQPAAQEIASLVANYSEEERDFQLKPHHEPTRSDLARFVRLGSTGGEYMLYATSLAEKQILALAFDVETPFSKIRSQTSQLARALATQAPATQQASRTEPLNNAPTERLASPTRPVSLVPRSPVQAIPDLSGDWIRMENLAKELRDSDGQGQDLEDDPDDLFEKPSTRQNGIGDFEPAPRVPARDTNTPMIVLEPAIPGVINLVYACVVIPRLPQHTLSGDLVRKIIEWIGQLCLAFGWRLESILVEPGYVQWIVNVPPTTSPSYLMRILRQHTSKRIFAEFPALAQENPSGDFWAPGYLIMSSPTPPPETVIQEFIQQLRHHQGASNKFTPHFER
ncbi:MAG: IS200/IS605 family transposase [Anaerolineales bacterium]|jgi:REP element-mobilizing transposase RayT|nr:IS200/IS605 family transposase [Anaerolineales bacterium]